MLPEIVIDLDKIEHNTKVVLDLARQAGVEVVAVTKAFLAEPQIAGAMLRAGIKMLADARIENLEILHRHFPDVPLMLLRLPGLSQVKDTVRLAAVSLNSELKVLRALSEEARRQGKKHRVILMVDLGDLREGIWAENLPEVAAEAMNMDGLVMDGLGVNLACYGGIIPNGDNLGQLVSLAQDLETSSGQKLKVISGGNSASLPLLLTGELPSGINQLRIGEGILLGRETVKRRLLPGAAADAFVLRAEVLESQDKPTVPIGNVGQDAFGETPQFEDKGWRRRAILALGRQDVPPEGISPLDERVKIFGASSDHLIVDITDAPEVGVGSVLEFNVRYAGLLGSMTSPYVHKRFVK
ncbi:alanine/ornithine racemase family PLP-dependent enzyme [Paradesulfitobacterium ferrireducens]|uniref:alanine/ornithine racemase family PLP-dependent enzyme n=1 Tax=Paradesulfitobacterium ferrireducens TaxID=2816476 RepID=UPI001A8E0DA4|nr:alanine/ornithine racemase family PLP-dependent enzyme [Paradesulfitobacterium ferrireducens]